MNYVISIVTPEALPRLEELTEELALPLNVTLLGYGTAIQRKKPRPLLRASGSACTWACPATALSLPYP